MSNFLDIAVAIEYLRNVNNFLHHMEFTMSSEQKGVWIEFAVAAATYIVYAILVLGEVGQTSWPTAPYAPLMLSAIGASIVATIVIRIIVSIASPKDAGKRDIRDRQIHRFGEYIGRWAIIAGAVIGLLLAILRVDQFWIANEIYLAFFVSAVLAAATKLIGYRRGVPAW